MIVEVQDFNDCPPNFINPPMSESILEDAANGSVIHTFTVSDCDSGINGVNGTRFSIIAGKGSLLFSVNLRNTSGCLISIRGPQ